MIKEYNRTIGGKTFSGKVFTPSPLPKLYINPVQPGILRSHDKDEHFGILVGNLAEPICRAINEHEALIAVAEQAQRMLDAHLNNGKPALRERLAELNKIRLK